MVWSRRLKLCAPYDQTRIIGLLDSIGALTYNKTRKDKKTSVRIQNHVTSCYQIQVDIVRRHLDDHYKNVNNGLAESLPEKQPSSAKGTDA
jgi:hypothetical protein